MQVLICSLFLVLINATLSADMFYSVKYQTIFELRSEEDVWWNQMHIMNFAALL